MDADPLDGIKMAFFFLKASLNLVTRLTSVACGKLLCSSSKANSPSGLPRKMSYGTCYGGKYEQINGA